VILLFAIVKVETLMRLIGKVLGSILVPKTIYLEFLQLLQARALLPTTFPLRDSLIMMLFLFIQGVSIQSVPGRIF
jgi:hypothetical protein